MAITYRNQGNAFYRDDQQTRAYQRGQVVPYDVNGAPPVSGGSGSGTTTNALTFDNSGAGAASGSAFNGSVPLTISYNSIGAQPAGAYLTGNQTITFSGDASGSGSTSVTLTLATVNSSPGTFGSATKSLTATVNGKGLITALSEQTITPAFASLTGKPTTLAGYGITDAQPLSANLTAYAGAAWSTGVQVPTLTAANTIALKTVGAAAGNLLDKAAGDSLYQPIGSYLTGNQTITISGDASGSGATAITLAIGANKVTFSKFVAATAASIVGATAAGNFAQLTPAQAKGVLALTAADVSGLAAIATSGSASDLGAGTVPAARMPAFTGDVTSSAGTVALTIGTNAVTFSKFVAATAAGIVGATAAGNFAQLTSAQAKSVLALTASDISGLAAVAISGSAADLIDGAQVLAQSAIAASVTGTVTKTSLATIVIPAGAMGANGRIEVEAYFTVTSNTNSKTVNMELAGSLLGGGANLNASVTSGRLKVVSANRNSQSSQYNVREFINSAATSAYAPNTSAVNTAVAQNLTITATLAITTDTVTLESYRVLLLHKA